ncbi:hypothetical protein M2432_000484 [Mycobacterium sp. OTB74]|jgi:hypothetical protein|nr:hypothetical protein [Mycobacterium sp. OTB74]
MVAQPHGTEEVQIAAAEAVAAVMKTDIFLTTLAPRCPSTMSKTSPRGTRLNLRSPNEVSDESDSELSWSKPD